MKIFKTAMFCFLLIPAAWAANTSWQGTMVELSKALSDIVPDLFSVSSTRDAQGFKNKAAKLYAITSRIDTSTGHGIKSPDGDPTVPYIAELFNKDVERAYKSIEEGQVEYAKVVLRSSVAYCIACHTRSEMGPKFPLLSAFSDPLKKAPWIDRISFQAASRQFDAVNQNVIGELEKPKATVGRTELEKSVRIALAIAVRVRQDPAATRILVEKVRNSPSVTGDLKARTLTWLKDIETWRSESSVKYKTDKELIAAARKVIGADAVNSEVSWVDGSEIRYLRASLLMHELLRRFPKSDHLAEGLYLIGLSYDVLQDLGLWSLHEMYYQSCIEKQPHSKLASRCFERYKESITLGYSGSSGTHIPSAVQLHLDRLANLAAPSKSSGAK